MNLPPCCVHGLLIKNKGTSCLGVAPLSKSVSFFTAVAKYPMPGNLGKEGFVWGYR